jgi:serine/threonine protein kinase
MRLIWFVWRPRQGRSLATGASVALKVVNKSQFIALGGSSEQMMTEVHVLDKLRHPNIIEIQAVLETSGYLIMALE